MPIAPGGLPDFSRAALLLDLDGTLIDIAPTPDSVVVPPALPLTLTRLRDLLGGALAVISGRVIGQIDHLLPGIPTAVSGEHGGAIRHHKGGQIERPDLPSVPDAWRDAGQALIARYPGALFEPKTRGFVLHFRGAPEAGPILRAALEEMLAPASDRFQLMEARMAWEIRPRGADKGSAVRAVMREAPFAGRLPVMIGDDVTDHEAIDAASALGGGGMLVPDVFGDAPGVRAWLAEVAEKGGW